MAKNKGKKTRTNKKYSYNDRIKYHKDRYDKFVDEFRSTGAHGSVNIDFDKLEAAENRNPKMQYSSGYSQSVSDSQRGYERSQSDMQKKSLNFQRGYLAARRARDTANNLKF